MLLLFILVALALSLALISLGGGFYDIIVVDPVWPRWPEMAQPARGGISRKRFWIPFHVVFELTLIAALALSWSQANLRFWLLIAFASHAVMRIWSGFDLIPKALAFERAEPGQITESAGRAWTKRSRLRLPLDAVTCFALLSAFATVARLA